MKKYLAMLLACAMIFAFTAGCAQQNPTNSDEPSATNAPTDVEINNAHIADAPSKGGIRRNIF